jgi:hypothetical protein
MYLRFLRAEELLKFTSNAAHAAHVLVRSWQSPDEMRCAFSNRKNGFQPLLMMPTGERKETASF